MAPPKPLRVGYVPEHFSAPLQFAATHYAAPITLHPFPSGTGAMITALSASEIDIGIGLTEAWIAGLAQRPAPETSDSNSDSDTPTSSTTDVTRRPPPYALVGTYVESPLTWAISTGAQRKDIATAADPGEWVQTLQGRRMGVSRIGSGSFVMGYVMADKLGWLGSIPAITSGTGATHGKQRTTTRRRRRRMEPFDVVPLQTFERLRAAVQIDKGDIWGREQADFFMWEHFTSKRYFDAGEIRKIGEVVTPWPSWQIVARTEILEEEEGGDDDHHQQRLERFFTLLDLGVKYFEEHHAEAVEYISTELDYSKEDAEEWLKTVQFAKEVKGVRKSVVDETLTVLKKAGVVEQDVSGEGMIKISREEAGLLSALTG